MISEVNKKRIIIIIISISIILLIYYIFGNTQNINTHPQEKIGVIQVTYSEENKLSNVNDDIRFSLTNQSDLPVGYQILLEFQNLSEEEQKNIKIYLNDELILDKIVSTDNIVITTNSLSPQYSNVETIEYNLKIEGIKLSTSKIVINDTTVNNIATDYIESLNYSNNQEGLQLIDGIVKYTATYSKNYLLFNDELWQIIGVYSIKDIIEEKHLKIVRVNEATNEEKQILTTDYINNVKDNDQVKYLKIDNTVNPQSAKDCIDADWLDFDHIKPTLYLNSNIKIIEGNGSLNNPYKIK